jgi:hypothetical protein
VGLLEIQIVVGGIDDCQYEVLASISVRDVLAARFEESKLTVQSAASMRNCEAGLE